MVAETVEQANALPKGTFVRVSLLADEWTRLRAPGVRDVFVEGDVPFAALAPIEAEEETDLGSAFDFGTGPVVLGPVRKRLVTLWEEA
jgi:hypothetical protein